MKSFFKILTFMFALGTFSEQVFAQLIDQSTQKTHLRWKIQSEKEQIKINKKGKKVIIQTLDPEFFESFSTEVSKLQKNNSYHENFKFIAPKIMGSPFKLEIGLKDNSIELFSFFKTDEGGHILDFWVNDDIVTTKKSSVSATSQKIKVAKLNLLEKKKVKKIEKKKSQKANDLLSVKNTAKFNIIDPEKIINKQTGEKFRDFRYGSAYIWDYGPLIPPLTRDVRLSNKGPDYLYKIKDRELLDDNREAHLQLSINFYNKEQWGLMTRSITLFEQTYGRKHKDINDFMKAVAMIKNSIKQKVKPKYPPKLNEKGDYESIEDYSKKGILAAAENLLGNVVDVTQDYELKKAALRYLIQSSRDKKDYIKTLSLAKNLYVVSSTNFDDEMLTYSSEVILNALANLKQLQKMKSFLSNKPVQRVLPKQVGLAYISFIKLSNDHASEVISDYRANAKSLAKPVHPTILFNTAEAYFRVAEYKKAVHLFDEFLNLYSFYTKSSHARLRVALSYDLLAEPYAKVIRLYKDAINKSSHPEIQHEAKLRYVGLRVARNKDLDKRDLETVAFIDSIPAKYINAANLNFKKLLWITRLRTLISTKRYNDALAYLSTIEVENLKILDQRTFHADGAEIVLGIIQQSYLKGDFARAVKIWEVYKNKYENKVGRSPYMNFIVSDSFIKLGLFDSFQRSMKGLEGVRQVEIRRFPVWVEAHKDISVEDYILELKMNKYLKQSDFKALASLLEPVKESKNVNYKYYKALVSYNLKKYNDTVKSVESLLLKPNIKNILTPKQSSRMLEVYLESLYESKSPSLFRRNVAALVNDMRRSNSIAHAKLIERADYLYMESLFSEKKVNYKLLSTKSMEFVESKKNGEYINRVKYLRAVSLLNLNENSEGKKILEELISGQDVPEYLKGLARSELTTLELNNRTL